MLFHEFDYLIFLTVVVIVYWILPHKWRTLFLLASSLTFYSISSYQYLPLIIASTCIDYSAGLLVQNEKFKKYRGKFLFSSIFLNLAILFSYKYYDALILFIANIYHINLPPQYLLNSSLPLGVSFYTFQTMSYTIDCYRRKVKADKSFINIFLYVTFFPQLIAGPIERAGDLLTQIQSRQYFKIENIKEGFTLFVWGMAKKVYAADNLIIIIENFYQQEKSNFYDIMLMGLTMVFRTYYDFSGYVDMARGAAKMLGFNLSINFRIFLLAKNAYQFWSHFWHVTLGTWIRDYIYIPFMDHVYKSHIAATIFSFLLVGLWHGPTLNWVAFGFFNAFFVIFHRYILKKYPKLENFIYLTMFPIYSLGGLFNYTDTWEKFRIIKLGFFDFSLNFYQFASIFKFTFVAVAPFVFLELYFEYKKDCDYYVKMGSKRKALFIGYCLALITVSSYYSEVREYYYFTF